MNVFFHSVRCSLNVSIVFFLVKKFYSLIKLYLSIFAFISWILGGSDLEHLCQFQCPEALSYVFSSKSFKVSGFKFRYVIHTELTTKC